MSLEEFEELFTRFEPVYRCRESSSVYTRRHHAKRQRAIGAGRKHTYDLRDRLAMTLFWLRAYTTYDVFADLYHLDKTAIQDNLTDVLDTLTTMMNVHLDLPQRGVPKLRSVQEVLEAFPEARPVIEACTGGTKA